MTSKYSPEPEWSVFKDFKVLEKGSKRHEQDYGSRDSYLLLRVVLRQVGVVRPAGQCAVRENLLGCRIVFTYKVLGAILCGGVGARLPLGSQCQSVTDEWQEQQNPLHGGIVGQEN